MLTVLMIGIRMKATRAGTVRKSPPIPKNPENRPLPVPKRATLKTVCYIENFIEYTFNASNILTNCELSSQFLL